MPVGGVGWRGEPIGYGLRRLLGIRTTPPHCATCGDEMIPDHYSTGFDRRGVQQFVNGMRCPRNPAGRSPFGFHGVGGYWNDCIPPFPLMGGPNGEEPSEAAREQHARVWAAYNAHRPWQEADR